LVNLFVAGYFVAFYLDGSLFAKGCARRPGSDGNKNGLDHSHSKIDSCLLPTICRPKEDSQRKGKQSTRAIGDNVGYLLLPGIIQNTILLLYQSGSVSRQDISSTSFYFTKYPNLFPGTWLCSRAGHSAKIITYPGEGKGKRKKPREGKARNRVEISSEPDEPALFNEYSK